MAVAAVVASVVVGAVTAGVSANQASIANKRAKNAQAAAKRQADEQTAALQALEQEPEAAIPTGDDQAIRRQRKRSIARQLARGGRSSTILTGESGAGGTLGA